MMSHDLFGSANGLFAQLNKLSAEESSAIKI